MTANVVMYSTTVCPYCRMAEQLLKNRGVTEIKKILIDNDEKLRAEKNQSAYGAANFYRRYACRRFRRSFSIGQSRRTDAAA